MEIGPMKLVILLVIILLIFGPKKLPELSRAIGRSIRDFKKGMNDMTDEISSAGTKEETKPSAPAAPAQSVSAGSEPKKENEVPEVKVL